MYGQSGKEMAAAAAAAARPRSAGHHDRSLIQGDEYRYQQRHPALPKTPQSTRYQNSQPPLEGPLIKHAGRRSLSAIEDAWKRPRTSTSPSVVGEGIRGTQASRLAADAGVNCRGVSSQSFQPFQPHPALANYTDESAARGPRRLHHRRHHSASPAAPHVPNHDDGHLKPPPRFKNLATMAPTVTVMPVRQTYFRAPPELYPMREQSAMDFVRRTERSMARGPPQAAYPSLQAPTLDPLRVLDAHPKLLNRPRKLSMASTTSRESLSRDSFESRMRASSWGSRTSYESMDSVDNPWRPEYLYQRPSPMKNVRKRPRPGELFAALPGEVLELILDELKNLHLQERGDSCSTCWMRDLCSMALSSRKWYKYARTSLYEDIQLAGPDSAVLKKRYKQCTYPRLVLLRRTLRSNRHVAVIVRSLKVPTPPVGTPIEEYHNLVGSVVMACPNFERLNGLYPRYNHSFDRLFQALSTRPRLKRMDWIIDTSPFQSPQRLQPTRSQSSSQVPRGPGSQLPPGDLLAQQSAAFMDLHANWDCLTTLTIHALPGGTLTPDHLVATTIAYLPSLQHLYLSRLPITAFRDNSLLALPPLRTLSLSHLPGVTSNGLSALATRSASQSTRRLVLRHINMDSMPALARLLSNCTRLESFAFVQSYAPMLPEDNFIWLMPYLASGSLRMIHWDITSHRTCASAADSILARSIDAGGFPALTKLRTPNDPEGIFQSLCRPQERADLGSDRFRSLTHSGSWGISLSAPTSPTKVLAKSPTMEFPPPDNREATDLLEARLAAQSRVDAARRFPRFVVNVVSENGMLVDKFGLGSFMGTIGSRIHYHLLPDRGAKDENGGLVGVEDLLENRDVELSGRDVCNGRWNMPSGPVDKKEKDMWWHMERGRWRGLDL